MPKKSCKCDKKSYKCNKKSGSKYSFMSCFDSCNPCNPCRPFGLQYIPRPPEQIIPG